MKKLLMGVAALTLIAAPAMAKDIDGKFAKMDKDGNGAISEAEFTAQKGTDYNFSDVDTDGNGSVSKEELAAHWEAHKDEKKR